MIFIGLVSHTPFAWQGTRAIPTLSNTATVEQRITGVLVDALQHLGQIGYALGMLESTIAPDSDD